MTICEKGILKKPKGEGKNKGAKGEANKLIHGGDLDDQVFPMGKGERERSQRSHIPITNLPEQGLRKRGRGELGRTSDGRC